MEVEASCLGKGAYMPSEVRAQEKETGHERCDEIPAGSIYIHADHFI